MAKSVYLATLIATIAVILVVFFSVSVSDDARAKQFNSEINQFVLENELQSSFADFDANNKAVYCTIVQQGIINLSKSANTFESQLLTFKENSFNTTEFYSVKRNYLLTNMILFRSFLMAREYCDFNTKPVLFFYAEDKSCEEECGVIGAQLFDLKDCNSFRAFNFPYNWPTYEFTKILEVKYGVNKPGTLVVDGEKLESLQSKEVLSKKLGCA